MMCFVAFLMVLNSLIPFVLTAQSYRDGYIIIQQQDTVNGLIKYLSPKKASKYCIFKEIDKKQARKYLPEELVGFRMNEGKFYISVEVGGKLIFLEYLVSGMANLYFFSDKNGPHYFIETDKSGLIELTEPDRIIYTDTGNYQLPPRYTGKLIAVLNDYDSINNRVTDVNLTHSSLIDLAKDYHDYVCDTVECIVFKSKLKPFYADFSVLGGCSFNHLNFGRNAVTNWSPGIEVSFNTELHNLITFNERFWLAGGLAFSYNKSYTLTKASGPKDNVKIDYNDEHYCINNEGSEFFNGYYYYVPSLKTDIDLVTLKIPITVNASFTSGKIRPYFGVGFINMFILSTNEDFIYLDYDGRSAANFPAYMLGFCLQGGIMVQSGLRNKLIINLTYENLLNLSGLNDFEKLFMSNIALKCGFGF